MDADTGCACGVHAIAASTPTGVGLPARGACSGDRFPVVKPAGAAPHPGAVAFSADEWLGVNRATCRSLACTRLAGMGCARLGNRCCALERVLPAAIWGMELCAWQLGPLYQRRWRHIWPALLLCSTDSQVNRGPELVYLGQNHGSRHLKQALILLRPLLPMLPVQ